MIDENVSDVHAAMTFDDMGGDTIDMGGDVSSRADELSKIVLPLIILPWV